MGRSEEGEKERERERRGKQGGRGQARQNKRRESAREGRRVYCRSEGKVNIKMENARNHGVCEEKDRDSNKEKETDRDWE